MALTLLPGTLDLLVLETLRWGSQHGYGITAAIQARSGDALRVDPGSLYPALHRLERQKLVTARWEVSEARQRVRVYTLSAAGRRKLAEARSRWERMTAAVAGVLAPRGHEVQS